MPRSRRFSLRRAVSTRRAQSVRVPANFRQAAASSRTFLRREGKRRDVQCGVVWCGGGVGRDVWDCYYEIDDAISVCYC